MREHKNFWDKNAGRYDRFMRKDRVAYDEMYVQTKRSILQRGSRSAEPCKGWRSIICLICASSIQMSPYKKSKRGTVLSPTL